MTRPRSSISSAEREIRSRTTKVMQGEPLVRGCLVTMRRVCGNANCHCACGEKHESQYLSQSRKGQAKLTYIPDVLLPQVRVWIDNYQKVQRWLEEISDHQLEQLTVLKEKRGRGGNGYSAGKKVLPVHRKKL